MTDASGSSVDLRVNGTRHQLDVHPQETLLELLRRKLALFGVRETCGIGVCGSCTVLDGDRAVSSCLRPAFSCDGMEVTTVEGLSTDAHHRVQEAFVAAQAFQCSFCTPGFVLSVVALLREPPERRDVDAALSGHLCRCGSYRQIREAVDRLLADADDDTGRNPDSGAPRAGSVPRR